MSVKSSGISAQIPRIPPTRRVRRAKGKSQEKRDGVAAQLPIPVDDGTARLAMIQALIPLGLKAVEAELLAEVDALAGNRYEREENG